MSEYSDLIQAIERGDPTSAERLLPLVYDELRKLAAACLAREQPGQTLQPTALVHEAYLRLQGGTNPEQWAGRRHFFAAAAVAIRRILIENARRRKCVKRGGDAQRQEFHPDLAVETAPDEDVIALDEALELLAGVDPRAAQLVELLHFAGLTLPEAAEILEISPRTAGRVWAFARAWLRVHLEGELKSEEIS